MRMYLLKPKLNKLPLVLFWEKDLNSSIVLSINVNVILILNKMNDCN
jgi:hypothetical protein